VADAEALAEFTSRAALTAAAHPTGNEIRFGPTSVGDQPQDLVRCTVFVLKTYLLRFRQHVGMVKLGVQLLGKPRLDVRISDATSADNVCQFAAPAAEWHIDQTASTENVADVPSERPVAAVPVGY